MIKEYPCSKCFLKQNKSSKFTKACKFIFMFIFQSEKAFAHGQSIIEERLKLEKIDPNAKFPGCPTDKRYQR